jgi:hypothetical protein|tara:strand:+ start:457 stop:561 length:105 start_codon:yes stop_codon:yes gene_type:complete
LFGPDDRIRPLSLVALVVVVVMVVLWVVVVSSKI